VRFEVKYVVDFVERLTPSTHHHIRKELLRISRERSRELRILDIGAGNAYIWERVSGGGWPERNSITLNVVCLDVIPPAVSVTSGGNMSLEHSCGQAPGALAQYSSRSFDFVVCLDMIEHLEKSDGYRLLYEIERISQGSLIRTPNGFVWQPPHKSNPFQAHISGWTPKELRQLGWKIQFGDSGQKSLVGGGTYPKWITEQNFFWDLVRPIARPILALSKFVLLKVPSLSAQVVAVRRRGAFDLESHSAKPRGTSGP